MYKTILRKLHIIYKKQRITLNINDKNEKLFYRTN